jgi:C1A family cysteine protease
MSTNKTPIVKPPSRTIKGYGWTPDVPDIRDYQYSKTLKLGRPTSTPDAVDLRAFMPPVVDQGNEGTCTLRSTIGMLMHNQIITGQQLVNLSTYFGYYNARALEGSTITDSGAMLRDVIASLATTGICPEPLWPDNPANLNVKPPQAAYDAAKYKVGIYARLNSLDDMFVCLAGGHPFVFGMSVYEAFESDETARTGNVFMPGANEKQVGAHAVCAVGYIKSRDRLIVRNSWGPSWGMAGYFTLPFSYATNRGLCDDFWTVSI